MKRIIGLFFFLILLNSSCKEEMFLSGELPLEENALLDLAIEEKAMMGIAAGYSSDNSVWTYAAGLGDEDSNKAFSTTMLTRLASIAKPMTAIGILQLFETGQLDLDSPIQEYLPDFPVKPEGTITVRHLLNHSSGIAAYQNEAEIENQIAYDSIKDAIDIFKDRELVAVPGTAFNYTTYGYVVLGGIIETVSGQSYEDYIKENIWDVAGMINTGIEQRDRSYENKSELYHRNNRGNIEVATPNNLSDRIPGGGFYSTLDDMMKFGNAILDNAFISEESLEIMFEIPSIENNGIPYGLGWYFLDEIPNYGSVYGHPGAQTGASTMFLMLPEQDFFVIVLSNTSRASDEVLTIASRLFEIAGG